MGKKNLTREDYEELDERDRRRHHQNDRDRRDQRRSKRVVDEPTGTAFDHRLID